MTTDHDTTNTTPTKRPAWKRNTRLAGMAAAMIMGLNWCHGPTPDINIFHNNNDGQLANPSAVAE